MPLLVLKFGGTSLATLKHINHAADIVASAIHEGNKVVVIVSAMSGETDRLISLANQMSESPSTREYAALLATGEQVSMALMSMALINRGISARSYTGWQARIQTDSQYKKARIQSIDTAPILSDVKLGCVPVIAGFQGVDAAENITTLGRGGSDTTAVAIAAALGADECQIYTDVDGVYTTDPRIVPDAKRLERVTFSEMLELASLGAKVLQIRAVEFAGKYNVPLRVLSSIEEGPGTLVTYERQDSMESPSVTGIAYCHAETKMALLGLPDVPGITSTILSEVSALGVNVDMIHQLPCTDKRSNLVFTVHRDEHAMTLQLLQKQVRQVGALGVESVPDLAKLSLVGAGLKSHPEVAPLMFKTLADVGIHIHLISTSEIKISVLVDACAIEEGVRALHRAFHLEHSVFDETVMHDEFQLAVAK